MQFKSVGDSQYHWRRVLQMLKHGARMRDRRCKKPRSSDDWMREGQRMTYAATGSLPPFWLNCPILEPGYAIYGLAACALGCGLSLQPRRLATFALEVHTQYLGLRVINPDAHQNRCTTDLAIFDIFSASSAGIDAELQWLSAPGTSIFDRV
jgi:hypothetical protein